MSKIWFKFNPSLMRCVYFISLLFSEGSFVASISLLLCNYFFSVFVSEAEVLADYLQVNSSSICFNEKLFRSTTATEEYFE